MSTEVKKTVHGWFLGFASLLLAIALGVLFSAASDLTDASMQFNALTVKQPRFADFVGPQRYDMLMKFGWKGLLPVALSNVVAIALSMALRQRMGFAGHLVAVLIAVAVALVLLLLRRARYSSTVAVGDPGAGSSAPIQRPSVAVSIRPNAPREI